MSKKQQQAMYESPLMLAEKCSFGDKVFIVVVVVAFVKVILLACQSIIGG